ncbi:MAG: hypothetical protein M1144_01305 [Candidatus Thermoplasmatota archaeon]|jgi:DNA-directed RNA polymerase subunit F|nr:hypothetical protein [Candidatus Thermoplasmatota archaeon]MCL5984203.1 hypothetical protein [Candidatus Thermoplasmatota archaeon]
MTEPVALWRVKEMLTQVSTERTLQREGVSALQHADAAQKLEPEVAKKLAEELKTLPFLSDSLTVKILDILPETPEEVWLLFPKDSLPLDEAQIKTVLETLAKHR